MPRAWYNGVEAGGGGGGLSEAEVLALLASERATYLTPGAGLPAGIAPVILTGTGAAASRTVSMPSALTLSNGRKYRVEGRISARKADGTLLLSRKVEGTELARSAGVWTLVTPGDVRLLGDAHADVESYFATDAARPTLGFDGANLTVDWNAVAAQAFLLEADLNIAATGVSTD